MVLPTKFTSIIKQAFFVSFVLFLCVSSCKENKTEKVNITTTASDKNVWSMMDEIISNVTEPEFPDNEINILDHGANPDGKTKNTEAFKKAIAACAEKGGGKVIVPKGKYLTGAIHLDNNINLHLEEGSEILFSTNPKD